MSQHEPGAPADPCHDGDEIPSSLVLSRPGDWVELRIAVCGSSALAVADFDGRRVLSQTVSDRLALPIEAPGTPGDYLLVWTLAPAASRWRVQCEVAVQAAVQFRHRKTSESKLPAPKWAVIVRVRA